MQMPSNSVGMFYFSNKMASFYTTEKEDNFWLLFPIFCCENTEFVLDISE